ncbi:hypothetical protein C7M84_021586 [Penaeus vannamei]|uniref:Uncharacterized protein n=1 Tax=Penaeus vannamei TaxID=6689 RepID=A0A423S9H5_PENVA|nr:hypothetical protein C7M84_021586 [Penaeus vannamei]
MSFLSILPFSLFSHSFFLSGSLLLLLFSTRIFFFINSPSSFCPFSHFSSSVLSFSFPSHSSSVFFILIFSSFSSLSIFCLRFYSLFSFLLITSLFVFIKPSSFLRTSLFSLFLLNFSSFSFYQPFLFFFLHSLIFPSPSFPLPSSFIQYFQPFPLLPSLPGLFSSSPSTSVLFVIPFSLFLSTSLLSFPSLTSLVLFQPYPSPSTLFPPLLFLRFSLPSFIINPFLFLSFLTLSFRVFSLLFPSQLLRLIQTLSRLSFTTSLFSGFSSALSSRLPRLFKLPFSLLPLLPLLVLFPSHSFVLSTPSLFSSLFLSSSLLTLQIGFFNFLSLSFHSLTLQFSLSLVIRPFPLLPLSGSFLFPFLTAPRYINPSLSFLLSPLPLLTPSFITYSPLLSFSPLSFSSLVIQSLSLSFPPLLRLSSSFLPLLLYQGKPFLICLPASLPLTTSPSSFINPSLSFPLLSLSLLNSLALCNLLSLCCLSLFSLFSILTPSFNSNRRYPSLSRALLLLSFSRPRFNLTHLSLPSIRQNSRRNVVLKRDLQLRAADDKPGLCAPTLKCGHYKSPFFSPLFVLCAPHLFHFPLLLPLSSLSSFSVSSYHPSLIPFFPLYF